VQIARDIRAQHFRGIDPPELRACADRLLQPLQRLEHGQHRRAGIGAQQRARRGIEHLQPAHLGGSERPRSASAEHAHERRERRAQEREQARTLGQARHQGARAERQRRTEREHQEPAAQSTRDQGGVPQRGHPGAGETRGQGARG
jgi:hypothetical protein